MFERANNMRNVLGLFLGGVMFSVEHALVLLI